MRKRKLSQITKCKISASQKGKRNSMYGKKHTAEALRKIKQRSRGRNNPMFGKRHSAAAIRKMVLAKSRNKNK